MEISVLDTSAVAIVIAVSNEIRKALKVPDRWVPLIPVAVAQFAALPLVYMDKGGVIGKLPLFLTTSLWQGIKIAALAMSAYKLGKTTLMNQGGKPDVGQSS